MKPLLIIIASLLLSSAGFSTIFPQNPGHNAPNSSSTVSSIAELAKLIIQKSKGQNSEQLNLLNSYLKAVELDALLSNNKTNTELTKKISSFRTQMITCLKNWVTDREMAGSLLQMTDPLTPIPNQLTIQDIYIFQRVDVINQEYINPICEKEVLQFWTLLTSDESGVLVKKLLDETLTSIQWHMETNQEDFLKTMMYAIIDQAIVDRVNQLLISKNNEK